MKQYVKRFLNFSASIKGYGCCITIYNILWFTNVVKCDGDRQTDIQMDRQTDSRTHTHTHTHTHTKEHTFRERREREKTQERQKDRYAYRQ